MNTAIKVGDIFAADWGYDQTQTSWFKVVAVKPKTASLVELGETRRYTDHMCGKAKVDVNRPIGNPKTYKIRETNTGGVCFKIASYAWAYPADPNQERFFSTWH